jgi:hypothetical protein
MNATRLTRWYFHTRDIPVAPTCARFLPDLRGYP